jgi:hypothetical protein
VPSERCSIEEQPIKYCGWACLDVTRHNTQELHLQCRFFLNAFIIFYLNSDLNRLYFTVEKTDTQMYCRQTFELFAYNCFMKYVLNTNIHYWY